MINYKVNVDLGNNFTKQNLAKYNLGKYKVPFCTIFVQDKNPDGAAGKVLTNLINIILEQTEEDDLEAMLLCRKIRRFIRITSIKSE